MPAPRKRPAFRAVPAGITLDQAQAYLAGTAPPVAAPELPAPVAPSPAAAGPPRPTPRQLCRGVGCNHIPMHDTPVGRLCASCRDRLRGFSDPGVRHIGGLRPFQGVREDA